MKNLSILFVSIILSSTFFLSCSKEENPINNQETVLTLTMNHWGVDWSAGQVGSMNNNLTNPDGETIAWCEYGTSTNYYEQMITYRPITGLMYKVTTTDLTTITSFDSTKLTTAINCGDAKLKPNDIWVSRCPDGYVAFKVIEAPQDSATIAADHDWKVKVQYKFSTSTSF